MTNQGQAPGVGHCPDRMCNMLRWCDRPHHGYRFSIRLDTGRKRRSGGHPRRRLGVGRMVQRPPHTALWIRLYEPGRAEPQSGGKWDKLAQLVEDVARNAVKRGCER
jgi:hypothetical protein